MSFLSILKNTFLPHEGNNHHPHALRHPVLFSYTLAIILVKVLVVSLGAVYPSIDSLADTITPYNVYSETNKTRQSYKIQELTLNAKLSAAAQAKADDMMLKQYFAHMTPEGYSPWYWVRRAGYHYIRSGENLAIHFTDTKPMNQAWMASETHKKNLLNPEFSETGVGIAIGEYQGFQTIIVVQMFGKPLLAATAHNAITQNPSTSLQAASVSQNNNPQVNQISANSPTAVLGLLDNEQISYTKNNSVTLAMDEEQPTQAKPISELTVATGNENVQITLQSQPLDQVTLTIDNQKAPMHPSVNKTTWSATLVKENLNQTQEPQLITAIIKNEGEETEQPLAWVNFAASTQPLQLWGWTQGLGMDHLGRYTPERIDRFVQFFYLLMLAFLFLALTSSVFIHLHKPNTKLIAHIMGVMSVLLIAMIFI